MRVTDEMAEAACKSFFSDWGCEPTGDQESLHGFMRTAIEAALAQQAGAVEPIPYATLGNWYNLLCHGFMYAREGNAGCANTAIREVLDGLEAIRNAHGPDASFASLASSGPGGGGEGGNGPTEVPRLEVFPVACTDEDDVHALRLHIGHQSFLINSGVGYESKEHADWMASQLRHALVKIAPSLQGGD